MRFILKRAEIAALAVVVAGCGGGEGGGGGSSQFPTMGMPGTPSPARIGANLVLAEVEVNGMSGPLMLVDTGSPFTLVDPSAYPGIQFPSSPQVMVDLTFGVFTVDNVPAVVTTAIGNGDVPQIVGGNLMREFPVQLDYSEREPSRAFRLGESNMAAVGVEQPGGSVSFTLEGGGMGRISEVSDTTVSIPATRVPVTVDIEGTAHPFILDTGASEVTVRSSVYATLTADGRSQLSGLPIGTAMGHAQAEVTRAKTITVGGQTVQNAPVMTIGDAVVDALESEVNHPIDGLLGGSFLREFLVTIDYPHTTLLLQRYAPPLMVNDEFKRVGIEIGTGSGGHRYTAGVVYPGTDAAAKQISVGDEIVSVDGQSLDALDAIAADESLNGTVGTTKQIKLGATAVPALSNTTVSVQVEDLIPVP